MTAAGTSGTGPGWGSAAGGGALGRAPSQPGASIAAPPRGIPAGSPALPRAVGGSGAPVRLCQAGRRSRHGSYLGSGRHKTSCTGELGEVPGTGTVWGGAFSCPQLPPAPAPPAPSFAASTSPSPPGSSLPSDPAAPGTCWGGLPAPCAPRCPPPPRSSGCFSSGPFFFAVIQFYFFFCSTAQSWKQWAAAGAGAGGGCSQRGSALAPCPLSPCLSLPLGHRSLGRARGSTWGPQHRTAAPGLSWVDGVGFNEHTAGEGERLAAVDSFTLPAMR